MLKDLVSRSDLNLRTARVLDKSWTEAAQHPGRVPVEMVTVKVRPGKKNSPMVQIWVKLDNLAGPILDPADMTAPPYDAMTPEERTETSLQMLKPPKPAPAPTPAPAPSVVHERHNIHRACGPLFMKEEPEPAPATRAPQPNEPANLFQDIYESIEAPAPAPAPAAAAIPSSDHENPWDFSDSEGEDEPALAPAPDRRARLRNMMQKHCPRPHYCIYCGSEGLYGDKCAPCGFYRGSHCFGPNGPLQKGDTLMGRKLAFVKWPWQGDPEAPYVRAGAAADAAPKSKYAVDPPPVRAMTRDEVLGPNPCAEVCPKYPQSTAARLVAYVLGKVDHVTPGVQSDFRYYLQTNEDWRKTRERIIEIHEAGEENAAEVLHEEYLVAHHTLCQTPPAYLPADWGGMKRRVKARQKKDKGAEEPEALAYPDSDADEEDVAAYMEAMALRA